MSTEFTDIPGFEGRYKINRKGDVLTLPRRGVKKHLLATRTEKGYRRVWLYSVGKSRAYPVHQLVARTFISNPENKPYVNHKDGNRSNNSVENLEWCTAKENYDHSVLMKRNGSGETNGHYGYSMKKLFPDEELRNRLVELGIPRHKHNLAELGEMLPARVFKETLIHQSDEKAHLFHIKYDDNDDELGEVVYTIECGKFIIKEKTEASARAKMLIYLIENDLIGAGTN